MNIKSKYIINCSLSLLLACSLQLNADVDNNPNEALPWYQVEVFIFSYKQPINADQQTGAELWPQQLGLKYPPRLMQLHTSAESEVSLDILLKIDTEGEITGDQLTDIKTTESQTTIISNEEQDPAPTATDNLIIVNNAADATHTNGSVAVEQPFILLPVEQFQLAETAQRLTRQSDIQQLFHAAWRQPIAARNKADSILIRGGQGFDSHFELEGYITLGLERYLHINTDLWLSHFVSNTEAIETPWPILPRLPLASNARVVSADSPITIGMLSSEAFADTPSPLSTAPLIFNPQLQESGSVKTDSLLSIQQLSQLNFDNPFLDMANNQYSVKRTITMRQQRRMRSRELHYIDHPLMGLIIKITPYELPQPDIEEVDNKATDATKEINIEHQTTNQ